MISVLIMTYNEELNIAKCIESLNVYRDLFNDVIIVDSYSDDATISILNGYDVSIYQNKWLGYSAQLNWSLQHCDFKNNWLLRVDADEEIFSLNRILLMRALESTDSSLGYIINIHRAFLGQRLKFGGTKIKLIRLVRLGGVQVSNAMMDEKFICEKELFLKSLELIDIPRISIDGWIKKHLKYAHLEIQQIGLSSDLAKKRFYYSLPLFWRCLMYFLIRYILFLGFLDGKKGFLWHFYQAFWYRVLVDTKIQESKVE